MNKLTFRKSHIHFNARWMLMVLLTFIITSIAKSGNSQHHEYGYDSAGNRTIRLVITLNLNSSTNTNPDMENATDSISTHLAGLSCMIYPNPVESQLKIDINSSIESPIFFQLTDLNGRILESFESSTPYNLIDLTSYKTGSYFLNLLYQDIKESFKIIKL